LSTKNYFKSLLKNFFGRGQKKRLKTFTMVLKIKTIRTKICKQLKLGMSLRILIFCYKSEKKISIMFFSISIDRRRSPMNDFCDFYV